MNIDNMYKVVEALRAMSPNDDFDMSGWSKCLACVAAKTLNIGPSDSSFSEVYGYDIDKVEAALDVKSDDMFTMIGLCYMANIGVPSPRSRNPYIVANILDIIIRRELLRQTGDKS